ncbi:MAG: YqhA family protein [Anaerolineae bacterium]|jgi:uncharacterized membrane protein YqhA|nr:YqhA family protein [Anaerolineae bacterium]
MRTSWLGSGVRTIERRIVVSSRFFTLVAVFGSLAAAGLMFFLGLYNVYEAFRFGVTGAESSLPLGTAAVISVIEALDRFLIAIVLLYFSFGVYSLFIHPEQPGEILALPQWLQVRQIGQLKQVVAEVIIVILFVLFLRVALQTFQKTDVVFTWITLGTLLVLPLCTVLLALALRLVQLHPKTKV